MLINIALELSMESIPGCVLQLYVWFASPEQAGSYTLVSIAISALTTDFTSAMISFNKDVDVAGRRDQPKFYGYIPDDNGARTRCFVLMTLISALLNVSRSVGCALLTASDKRFLVVFVGIEVSVYLAYKIARGDFFYWIQVDGALAIVMSFVNRVIVKIIVDYTGCLHYRHP